MSPSPTSSQSSASIAFGSKTEREQARAAGLEPWQTAGAAMRLLWVCNFQQFHNQEYLQQCVEVLRQEWNSGQMPIARQEAILRRNILLAGHATSWTSAQCSFFELAQQIARHSSVDWTRPGWTCSSFQSFALQALAEEGPATPSDLWEARAYGAASSSLLTLWSTRFLRSKDSETLTPSSTRQHLLNSEPSFSLWDLAPNASNVWEDPAQALWIALTQFKTTSGQPHSLFSSVAQAQKALDLIQRFVTHLAISSSSVEPPAPIPDYTPALWVLFLLPDPSTHSSVQILLQKTLAEHRPDWLNLSASDVGLPSHPLWLLSSPNFKTCAAKLAQILIDRGYGVDGSLPSDSQCAWMPPSEQPNALWSLLYSSKYGALCELAEVFLKNGVNWREKGGSSDPQRQIPMLQAIAQQVYEETLFLAQGETLFRLLIDRGVSPLEALPQPSLNTIPTGFMREIVSSHLERQTLEQGMQASAEEIEAAMAWILEQRQMRHQMRLNAAAESNPVAPSTTRPPRSRRL